MRDPKTLLPAIAACPYGGYYGFVFGIYAIEKALAFASLKIIGRSPSTFNEKIRFKAAFDRRPILKTFADKYMLRNYVLETVGESYLPSLYAWGTDLRRVGWEKIPNDFVFKVNHGSGGVVIVRKDSKSQQVLPQDLSEVSWTSFEITPDRLIHEHLIALGEHWMAMDYYHYRGCNRMPEWAYKGMPRKFLFEEVLLEDPSTLATDYKFHMFNGKCEFINTIRRNVFNPSTGEIETTSDIFSSAWEPLKFELNSLKSSGSLLPRPKKLEEMIGVSEKLTGGIDYLRVDLYSPGNNRVIVGELTNYPMAGQMKFEPAYLNTTFGQKLSLDTAQYRRF